MPVDSLVLPDQLDIVLDDEFASLNPPLSEAERQGLEASLRTFGCLDPMILWAGCRILLDGHNRLPFCRTLDIPFSIRELPFPDRDAARAWIIQHQLDERRNLTADGASYLRGIRYLAEKRPHGGDRQTQNSSGQDDHLNGPSGRNGHLPGSSSGQSDHLRTEARLAAEYRVSPKTIRRDGSFTAAVHLLAKNCGHQARLLILSGDARLRRSDVDKLVRLDPADQKQLLDQVREFGRQPLPWARPRDADRITVPIDPAALAHTVIERLGKTNAARVRDELVAQLSSSVSEEFEPTGNHSS